MSQVPRRLRRASAEDAELFFRWANDPDVRRNSFRSDPIAWSDHVRWFSAKLRSASTAIWVLEVGGMPAGQVRYEAEGETAEVGISIGAEHRGRGYSVELLRRSADLACRKLAVRKLIALVIEGNEASRKAFLHAGYREDGSVARGGRVAWRFERGCGEAGPGAISESPAR